jgi:hypothetical protein
VLGGGVFTIGGEPRYVNEDWGLSFDPPVNWKIEAESAEYITFASPDRRRALALRVALGGADLVETSDSDLALFQEDHPEAEIVATEEVTMSGNSAFFSQMRYDDEESGEQVLFVVSAVHSGSVYSLWMLGPQADAEGLKTQFFAALRSIRLMADE